MKKWVLALALMAAAASLTACGQKEENTADTTANAEAGGEEGKKTINLALWDYETSIYDEQLVKAFEAAHPEYHVNVISAPNKDYAEKLTVMLAGGEDIDVYYTKGAENFTALVNRGNALALDDMIEKDQFDLTGFGDLVDLYTRDDNGSIHGLPYRTSLYMLFYNKNIFDDCGVPYPTNDMTWEEYEETAKKLTHGEGSEKIYGAFNIPKLQYQLGYWGQNFTDGQTIVDGDLNNLRKGLEMDYRMTINDKTAMDYASCKSMNSDQYAFYNGNIGMMYNGSWFVQMLAIDKGNQFDFDWGAVEMPYWEGGEKKSYATATNVVINSKTKDPEGSWELLKFVTGPEGAKIMADNYMLPGCIDDSVIQVFKDSDDIPEGVAEALQPEAMFNTITSTTEGARVQKIVKEEAELYLTENQDLDTSIANMEKRRAEEK